MNTRKNVILFIILSFVFLLCACTDRAEPAETSDSIRVKSLLISTMKNNQVTQAISSQYGLRTWTATI